MRRRGSRFTVVVALALAWSTAQAGAVVRTDAQHASILGDIDDADVAVVKGVADGASLSLDSRGGSISAAMKIGRLIRKKQLSVEVARGASCLSSCALLYTSGVNRQNLGEIGLHRPYLVGEPHTGRRIARGLPKMFADVRAFIAEMGVTVEVADIMFRTPPDTMRVFVGDEIRALVPDADPVFDEIRVAREARARGLPTDGFRVLEARARRECRSADSSAATSCRDAMLALEPAHPYSGGAGPADELAGSAD